jgi:hypothetical protein
VDAKKFLIVLTIKLIAIAIVKVNEQINNKLPGKDIFK